MKRLLVTVLTLGFMVLLVSLANAGPPTNSIRVDDRLEDSHWEDISGNPVIDDPYEEDPWGETHGNPVIDEPYEEDPWNELDGNPAVDEPYEGHPWEETASYPKGGDSFGDSILMAIYSTIIELMIK